MSVRELRLAARVEELEKANAFVRTCAAETGMEAAQVPRVLLALEEAFVNIASYAYAGGAGEAEIACAAEDGRFVLTLRDEGAAFDPLARAAPDLTLPLETRGVGGVGVALIRAVTEEVSYRRVDGRNLLRMVFGKGGC